jgi:hypothetical protein
MSQDIKGPRFLAVLLLSLIILMAVTMWSLDLVAQQRTLAFLLSAELIAFAMFVYLYYGDTPKEVSRQWLFSGAVALVILVLLGVAVH